MRRLMAALSSPKGADSAQRQRRGAAGGGGTTNEVSGPAETTYAKGRRGEDRAAALLRDRGYAVVERNYRCPKGELDVIARDGDTLVFVEVRTRADARHGTALETVRAGKQRRVAAAAAHYLAVRRPVFTRCRFDVLAITGDD